MKTAISLPDELFQAGETTAEKLSISRSELYARALAEFLKRREKQALADEANDLYATESSELDPVLKEIQYASLDPEKW